MLVIFLDNIHPLVLLIEYHKKQRPVVRGRASSKLTSMDLVTLKLILKNMATGTHVSVVSS